MGPDETSRAAAAVASALLFFLLILFLRLGMLRLRMRCLRHMLRLWVRRLRMRRLRHMLRQWVRRLRMRLLGDALWSRAGLLFEMRFGAVFHMVRGLGVGRSVWRRMFSPLFLSFRTLSGLFRRMTFFSLKGL